MGVGLVYATVHRAFPDGFLGGAVYGLVLLVLVGTVEPLRAENPDFEFIGPGWLAIVCFTLLAIVAGAFNAVAAGHLSQVLPLPGSRSALYMFPLALFVAAALLFLWPVAVLVVVAVVVVLLYDRLPRLRATSSRRRTLTLRVVMAVAVVASLPGFAGSLTEIAT